MRCSLPNPFMDERLGKLAANPHKTKFNTFDAPFFIERKDFIQLLLNGPPVDVENQTDSLGVSIIDHLFQTQGILLLRSHMTRI